MTLKEYRKTVLFESLREVARRAGVSAPTLREYEMGRPPKRRRWPILAAAYQLTVADFEYYIRSNLQVENRGNAQPAEASEGIPPPGRSQVNCSPISPA